MPAQSTFRLNQLLPGLLSVLVVVLLALTPVTASGVSAKGSSYTRHGRHHADQQRGALATTGKHMRKGHSRNARPAKSVTRDIGANDTTIQQVTTYRATITCPIGVDDMDGDPQTCDVPYQQVLARPTPLKLEVISSPQHCSDVHFFIEWRNAGGEQNWTSARLGPGDSTGTRDLGSGVEWYAIFAVGHSGGCNQGELANWSASVIQTTPRSRTPLP